MEDFIAGLILTILFIFAIWRVVCFFIDIFKIISANKRVKGDSHKKILKRLKKERPDLYENWFDVPLDLLVQPDEECKQEIEKIKKSFKNEKIFKDFYVERMMIVGNASGLQFSKAFLLSFNIFFDTIILPLNTIGHLRDNRNHISHNKYALMDFTLYNYFSIRATLLCRKLSLEDMENIDDIFFAITETYFNEFYSIPKAKTNRIIDKRMCEYEKIITSTSNENVGEAMDAQLCQFIQKDYHDIPLDPVWYVGSMDDEFFIVKEITSLGDFVFQNSKRHISEFLSHHAETKNQAI